MGQTSTSREISLIIQSGETQSLELYDFNSKDNRIVTNQLITNDTLICHDGENIIYPATRDLLKLLYSVKIDPMGIELQSSSENEKCLWRVLEPGEIYPLQFGNYIKLGKVKLRLRELVEEEKQKTEREVQSRSLNYDMAEVKSVSAHSRVSSQEKVCRICFQAASNDFNPLVNLCKCLGTVKYIHFECLKDWLTKSVVKRQHNNTLFYSYQQPKCELCRKYYQPEFMYQGKKYSLLDMEQAPNPPYAIFQGIDYEDESKRFSVFLIGLGNDQITIGRNSNSNVVMKEISVSRSHCALFYKNKQLFIKDKGSKFGTLIKAQGDVEFSPAQGISLQFQSKLLTIRQKNRLNCCCTESDNFILRIQKDNVSSNYFEDQD